MNKSSSQCNEINCHPKERLIPYSISRNGIISLTLFVIGSFLNFIAYSTLEPILVGLIFLLSCYFVLIITKFSGKYELQAFIITFSACWFWAGIAAIYANYFNDPGQNILDAANFYELASGKTNIEFNIFDLSSMMENAATIIIWETFYNFFEFLGFNKGPFIGISVNISFIAFTAVIGIRMVKYIFGFDDNIRIKRFIKIFWLCPVFWYFASVHIRDAVVLFSVSLLGLVWIVYLKDSTKINLIKLVIATIISFLVFGLLRTEFIFVPFAMILAGIVALLIGKAKKRVKLLIVSIIVFGLFLGSFFSSMQSDLIGDIESGNESYNALTLDESGDSSLGNKLIVSSAVPIRLILGSIYLFVFPIPFWGGFQLVSISHLFKSLNAIFMYGITPLFILAFWRIIYHKHKRTVPILFLLFLSIGFTLAIAYTSLETRHFASFLLPIMVISLLPDLEQKKDRLVYLRLLKWFIAIMIIIHFSWIIIKLL